MESLKVKQRKNNKKENIVYAVSSIAFYLFWFFCDGVQLCNDSESYITMNLSREPIYPIFLAVNRFLFGENIYLTIVVFLQCVLAAYSVYKIVQLVRDYSDSKYILPIITMVFQFIVVLICRFLAGRHATYTNEIATEGLSLSLYLLFVIQLYLYIKEKRLKNLLGFCIYIVILVNLRKQMLITFGIVFGIFILFLVLRKWEWKRYIYILGVLLLTFIASGFLVRGYNKIIRGEGIGYTQASSAVLITSLYSSDISDTSLFENKETRDAFAKIMSQVDEKKLNYKNMEEQKNWQTISGHYANNFDLIAFGVVNPTLESYVEQNYQLSDIEADIKFDEIGRDISKVLVRNNWKNMLIVFGSNMIKGFVNTIAKEDTLLNIYVGFAYAFYLGNFFWSMAKKRSENATIMAFLVGIGILVNVVCVSAMIFCQTRYMIYNLALFYTALAWLIYENLDMAGKLGKIKEMKW